MSNVKLIPLALLPPKLWYRGRQTELLDTQPNGKEIGGVNTSIINAKFDLRNLQRSIAKARRRESGELKMVNTKIEKSKLTRSVIPGSKEWIYWLWYPHCPSFLSPSPPLRSRAIQLNLDPLTMRAVSRQPIQCPASIRLISLYEHLHGWRTCFHFQWPNLDCEIRCSVKKPKSQIPEKRKHGFFLRGPFVVVEASKTEFCWKTMVIGNLLDVHPTELKFTCRLQCWGLLGKSIPEQSMWSA